MATGDRIDPYHGYNFRVELERANVAGFRECTGLASTVDPVEYREGTDPNYPRKLLGLRKFTNVTLRRGITDSTALWDWYVNLLNGVPDRRSGAVILVTEDHQDTALRWNFENGFIARFEMPSFNATTNDVAIEAVELAVERIVLATG
jgi:phage tail-like protein